MNLDRMLQARAAAGEPIRIGLIGAGKFGAMFLAQARHQPGFHLMAVADIAPERARAALTTTGWPAEQVAAPSFDAARRAGATYVTEDSQALIAADGLDVVVEATGDPAAGITHALACCRHGRHVIMVNVEADALAGPWLAREAEQAGLVYSFAYGDQPALICEMVDWARTAGFAVTAAGKGTLYRPEFHASTPDTVRDHYGVTPAQASAAGMNPKMFNSFLDGTKSGIEMAAVANATGLTPAPEGLRFPPCSCEALATVLRPASVGGQLDHPGQVEVISSVERDGRPVDRDLRWGVYVTFAAPSDYAAACFSQYGLAIDASGRYAAMYKPYHLIGLELGISVAWAALHGQPTGAPNGFRGDVVATAKRALAAGEMLDGEGGYTVWGRLAPAADSLAQGLLPIGLAQGLRLTRPVKQGAVLRYSDVALGEESEALRVRRLMERHFTPQTDPAAA